MGCPQAHGEGRRWCVSRMGGEEEGDLKTEVLKTEAETEQEGPKSGLVSPIHMSFKPPALQLQQEPLPLSGGASHKGHEGI